MADGLEEPGWPNLRSGAPPAGQTFMNAFLAVSETNRKRRQLEEQLTKMQMQMGFQEQKHELDMAKFERDSYFKQANLNRAYDMMAQRAYLQQKGFEFKDQLDEIKTARKDATYENAAKLGDELAAVSQQYPVGSQAFQNEMNTVLTKHASTLATPEGQRVFKTFQSEHTAAANEGHKYAAELRQNFDATLEMVGKGTIGREDFLQPESAWRTNDKGERFLARIQVTGVDGKPSWQVVDRQGEQEALKSGQKVRYDTLPSQAYGQLRKMHDRMLEIGGNDPSEKPAITGSPKAERARQALNDPDATPQEKAAAMKILGVQQ